MHKVAKSLEAGRSGAHRFFMTPYVLLPMQLRSTAVSYEKDLDPLQVSGNIFHFRLELSDMPNNSCHSLILVANCGVFGAK